MANDMSIPVSSHFFTNRDGNTLMDEFQGILENNPQVKNLDSVVGFLRASGYFALRPFLDVINKVLILISLVSLLPFISLNCFGKKPRAFPSLLKTIVETPWTEDRGKKQNKQS